MTLNRVRKLAYAERAFTRFEIGNIICNKLAVSAAVAFLILDFLVHVYDFIGTVKKRKPYRAVLEPAAELSLTTENPCYAVSFVKRKAVHQKVCGNAAVEKNVDRLTVANVVGASKHALPVKIILGAQKVRYIFGCELETVRHAKRSRGFNRKFVSVVTAVFQFAVQAPFGRSLGFMLFRVELERSERFFPFVLFADEPGNYIEVVTTFLQNYRACFL